jgi:hypothetical protein
VQDRDMIAPLLAVARQRFASLKKAIADGGYQGQATADAVQDEAGIPLEIVKRSDKAKGWTDGFAEVEFADRGEHNGVRARICWPAVEDMKPIRLSKSFLGQLFEFLASCAHPMRSAILNFGLATLVLRNPLRALSCVSTCREHLII